MISLINTIKCKQYCYFYICRIAIALIIQAWLGLSPAAAAWDKNCLSGRKNKRNEMKRNTSWTVGPFLGRHRFNVTVSQMADVWVCVYMCESISLYNVPEHLVNIASVIFVSVLVPLCLFMSMMNNFSFNFFKTFFTNKTISWDVGWFVRKHLIFSFFQAYLQSWAQYKHHYTEQSIESLKPITWLQFCNIQNSTFEKKNIVQNWPLQ